MIQMFCDEQLLYDPRNKEYTIANPRCELEINRTGSLSFRVGTDNPRYNFIQKMKSEIAIYQDGEWLASFRVLNTEQDFNNIKTVSCEGELAYLLDSNQRIDEYHDISVADYFATLVARHNADVDQFKQFTVGAVTVTDPNDSLYRCSNYESTWDAIQDKLVSRLGGCIRCRHVNGLRILDYVTDYGNVNLQVIRFGENILDLVREIRGEDIATVLIPLGAMDEETETRLTVASVNEGKDYIENPEAIAVYGRIVKTLEWDDVTLASNLLRKGYEQLASLCTPAITLTMTAVDLHLVDVSIERIKVGDSIRVVSEPHGLDEYMVVQKMTLDFQHPENSQLTLGTVRKTLERAMTDGQKEAWDQVFQAQSNIRSSINNVRTVIQECYSEISKSAEEIKSTVAESYVAKSELEVIQRDFQTSITQTSSEIRMDFTTVTNDIIDTINTNQALLEEYIRFKGALIELGRVGNAFTAELSNGELAFKENGQTIAYISNQSLVITNAEIRYKLSLGTEERGWFDFIPRSTGNLSIAWRDPTS